MEDISVFVLTFEEDGGFGDMEMFNRIQEIKETFPQFFICIQCIKHFPSCYNVMYLLFAMLQ